MKFIRILALLLTISISITIVPCFMLTANAAHVAAQMSIGNKAYSDSVAFESLPSAGEK